MTDHDEALDDAPDGTDDLHARAMERFDDAVLPQQEVRAQALEARRFASIPGAQWDGPWGEQFENSIRLQVDKLGRGLRKLENDYRQNRIVPDYRPSGGVSDADTADTLDGLHRADSAHFKAQAARDNGYTEATRGGFGAYRLTTEWADPLDKDSDEQRVNPGLLIADADQKVFFDPNATRYDKSDAAYAFVLTTYTPDAFARRWGDERAVTWPEGRIRGAYDWYRPDYVVVAEYYEVEDQDAWVTILTLPATGEEERHWSADLSADEIAERRAMGWTVRRRKATRRRCVKYVLSGSDVLSGPKVIAGGNIPVVPVYGNRYYIDGVEWFTGLTQGKMDPQRLYNSSVSKLMETNALAPREVPIFLAEQMPPEIARLWADQNIKRLPYLVVNPAIDPATGGIAAMGPVGNVTPPQLAPVTAALLEAANRDLTEDDQDGAEAVKANTSADAMDLAAARVDAKSGVYLDNMRQSVQREGELYLAMATEVYAEPGRVVETMTEDGDDGQATLFEEFRADDGTLKVRNDFSSGRYKVVASVTEATTTRRDRTAKSMLHIAEVAVTAGDTEGAQAAIITATANMDGEGLADFQKWNRRRALTMGLVEPNEDERREMEEAAQAEQQPDPNAVLAAAQAKALEAGAAKDQALTGKAVADTKVSEAKVLETLASAADKRVEAGLRPVEAANDAAPPPEPRIRFGYEGAA